MTAACSASFRAVNDPKSLSGPIAEFQPSATDYIRLRRIIISIQVYAGNSAFVFGLGKPATNGVGRPTPVVMLQEDASDNQRVPGLSILIDWSTLPTIPASFFRRCSQQITTNSGNVVILDFSNGLGIPPSGSLILWCISESVVTPLFYDISVEFDG